MNQHFRSSSLHPEQERHSNKGTLCHNLPVSSSGKEHCLPLPSTAVLLYWCEFFFSRSSCVSRKAKYCSCYCASIWSNAVCSLHMNYIPDVIFLALTNFKENFLKSNLYAILLHFFPNTYNDCHQIWFIIKTVEWVKRALIFRGNLPHLSATEYVHCFPLKENPG